jgi:hypothetical protein
VSLSFSRPSSFGESGRGEAEPLPAGLTLPDDVPVPGSRYFEGLDCWAAKVDRVEGDGTALAVSKDTGRGRGRVGMESVRASAAREGNEDEDAVGGGVSSLDGGIGGGGDGVRGGGGWPSEVSQASLASFSSRSARGSNSLSTSLWSFAFNSGSGSSVCGGTWSLAVGRKDAVTLASRTDGSGVCRRGVSAAPLSLEGWSSQGFGDAGGGEGFG